MSKVKYYMAIDALALPHRSWMGAVMAADRVKDQFVERGHRLISHVLDRDGDAALDVLAEMALAHKVRFTADGISRFTRSVRDGGVNAADKAAF